MAAQVTSNDAEYRTNQRCKQTSTGAGRGNAKAGRDKHEVGVIVFVKGANACDMRFARLAKVFHEYLFTCADKSFLKVDTKTYKDGIKIACRS